MRRAFTLVECLVAVAVTALATATAWAALRVAVGTVAAANRLSLENALMREAWHEAKRHVDLWTDLDDPDGDGPHRLRERRGGEGLPFTPMAELGDEAPADRARERAWSAADPETWWRGNANEFWRGDLRFGRYAIAQNREARLVVEDGVAVYGEVDVAHVWLPRRMHRLVAGLGFYAAADYLPANALWSWYGRHVPVPPEPWDAETAHGPDATGPSGAPLMCHRWKSRLCNDDGFQEVPRGLWRLTMASTYAVTDPRRAPAPSLDDLVDEHRRWYAVGYTADAGAIGPRTWRAFRAATDAPRPLLAHGPSHWPRVAATTARFVKNARFVALSTIRLVSPVTGETTRLSFSSLGTSLRGARRQRAAGGGWAADEEGLDGP